MKIRKETEMKIYVTHSNQWEYVQKLYQPLKQSRLEKEHEIYYPHDERSEERRVGKECRL